VTYSVKRATFNPAGRESTAQYNTVSMTTRGRLLVPLLCDTDTAVLYLVLYVRRYLVCWDSDSALYD